jgi:DNA invertase Pin-like site-specific DNA recombinase
MTDANLLPPSVVERKAVVYIRQSTPAQVQIHLESKRRQYELVDEARRRGFRDVEVIDDDLGRSADGTVARPGFEKLVAWLCAGEVGAVLCFDASRLARNGRDWHHLLELCGLVEARVIDLDGVYNPCLPNDRLLLGMKGSISEFESGVLRARMYDAARSKARRGELRISVPIGYVWHREIGLRFDPDIRVQEAIRLVFNRFRQLGSARQVHLSLRADEVHFPRSSDGKKMISFEWAPVRYRNVISVLKNPFYAGAYAYGKSENRTEIVDGRARKTYGHSRPLAECEILLKDHHEAYIDWPEFERNQKQLAFNTYRRKDGTKSGRGGRALLVGLLVCRRCGRRLTVNYTGRSAQPVYRCDRGNVMLGQRGCMTFGGLRIDAAVVQELIRAVEPMAIEAAQSAERRHMERQAEQQRILELELQQARYEASLAERRYAACDPDNRLIAATLEKSWEATLRRVQECETRLDVASAPTKDTRTKPDFTGLAEDLEAAWKTPRVTMRTRQQLLRTLMNDITVDLDEAAREIVLTIHWKGGQHSELRLRKPKTGEHGCSTSNEALAVIQSMASRWSDEDIAATLNRMRMPTGQGKTWTAHRVSSIRRVRGIHAYRPAEKDGTWLTLRDAAQLCGVTSHRIRRLIEAGILKAEQVVPGAPYQILTADLQNSRVIQAMGRKGRPCHIEPENQIPMFTAT